ncbi:MAG: radical SAM protein [Deltaproteobacteria bacterium]|nr:radical SAM protein [Deltaproteobacteria bacterium]MBW2123085.1 radical SAM protein [Deltaproteobacteria bacterium]
MYDPIRLAGKIESAVCRGSLRKYYRYRPAGFYGGIATADCVGCCLRCRFCWALNITDRPGKVGRLYSPEEVAARLVRIARSKDYHQVRVSGNEPTLCPDHLRGILEAVPQDLLFVLETNGIPIGADPGYAEMLAHFSNLEVRVSLKGATREEFQKLTGARPEAFDLQLRALENLLRWGVRCYPAVMASFSTRRNIEALRRRLELLEPDFCDLEIEEVICYPRVQKELERAGLKVTESWGYRPG